MDPVLEAIANGGKEAPESFDNFVPKGLNDAKEELEEIKTKEADAKEKVEDKPSTRQVDQMDEEEEKVKEVVKEEKIPEVKEEPEKPVGKTVRLKDGDEAFDVPEDATIRVKVKGKNEFVTIKELQEEYSGKMAVKDEMGKAAQKRQEYEQKERVLIEEKKEIAGMIRELTGLMDDPKKNPMEALLYLVDKSGRNVHDYTKRVYDYFQEEMAKFQEMDEVQQALYWKDRELGYLRSNQAAKERREADARAQRERVEQIERLRGSSGVSEEQYVQAHEELVKLGFRPEQVTPKAIVDYAVMKPHLDRAEGIAKGYEADLTDDQMDELVEVVAGTLRRNPKLSDEKAVTIAAEQLGWDVEVEGESVERKLASASRVRQAYIPPKKQQTDRPESFDDLA